MRVSRNGVCAWKIVVGLCAALLLSLPVFAQLNLGSITGDVTAQAGGPLVASVTIVDEARGLERPLTSDATGLYNAPSLTPGLYTVRIAATGYKTFVHSGITVGVGQNVKVDVVMQPGAETEVVTVTGDVSALSTSSAANAAGTNAAELTETPNNGSAFVNNVENRAGSANQVGGAASDRYGNGQRGDENNYLIDGVGNNEFYTGFSMVNGFGVSSMPNPNNPLPTDAIQETTQITNPTAEFGYKSGQTINLGIKSGTNTLHGLLFGLGRDADMDTRNPFSPSAPISGLNPASQQGKEPLALTNFGGNIGGPIKKDKLFYFADFYRFTYVAGNQLTLNAPTTASFANILGFGALGNTSTSIPDAIYGLICGTGATCGATGGGGTVNQLSLNMAGCGLEPGGGGYTVASLTALVHTAGSSPTQINCNYAGNASVFGNGTHSQLEPLDFPTPGNSTAGIAKIDYHINAHHSFNLDFYQTSGGANSWTGSNSIQPYWTVDGSEGAQIARAVWIWNINPNTLNEARVGFDRNNNQATNSDCAAEAIGTAPNFQTDMGLNTGSQLPCAMPEVSITGYGSPTLNEGRGAGPVKQLAWTTSGYDNFSHTMGKHVLRAGVEINVGGLNGTGNGASGIIYMGTLSFANNPAPTGSLSALEDFMAGVPDAGTIQFGDVFRQPQMNFYAAYVEDDWRVSSRISANLGIRYEYYTGYFDKKGTGDPTGNQFGSVCITCISGMLQQANYKPIYGQANSDNFGPHLGISWDITGKGTTVVRASFDILYATQSYSGLSSIAQVPTAAQLVEANGSLGPACCGSNTSVVPTGTMNNTVLAATYPNIPWTCGLVVSPVCPAGSTGPTTFGNVSTSLYCGDAQLASNAGGTTGPTGAVNPPLCTPTQIVPNLRVPYVPQWNVDLGHAFGKALTFHVGYVGNRGIALRSSYDMNQPTLGPQVPSGSASGSVASATINDRRPLTYECPATGPTGVGTLSGLGAGVTQGTGPYGGDCFPYFGKVLQLGNLDRSMYDALELSLAMRAYHGLTFNAAYTWAHWLAGEDFVTGETGSLQSPGMDFYAPHLDIGNVGIPQHFTITLNYQIPGRKSPGQILQGWAINSAILINPPAPAGITDSSDNLSGTSENVDRWTMGSYFASTGNVIFNSHNVGAFTNTGTSGTPCYGVAGSKYAPAAGGTGCAVVLAGTTSPLSTTTAAAYVSNMPAGCIAAATAEQSSPTNVPASQGGNGLATGSGGIGGLYELAKLGCYFENNTFLVPPAQGTFGLNMPGTTYLDHIFRQWDLAVTKAWRFKERYTATFRVDCFNCINITNYSGGGFSVSAPNATTDGIATKTPNSGGPGITIGNGSPREVQMGMRLTF